MVKDRLIIFIDSLELSQGKFEKECGISNGYVNNIRGSIGPNVLEKILIKYPLLNKIWLLHGEGEMLIDNNKPYHKKRHEQKLNNEDKTIPFYDTNAHGADPEIIEILPPLKTNDNMLHIKDLFMGSQYAIKVSGNSMTPSYPPGSIIGIRQIENKQIIPGNVYVLQIDHELIIKRLYFKDEDQDSGIFQCISDNTMKVEQGIRAGKLCYPPFYRKVDEVIKLFKVTGIYKGNELIVIN